MKMFGPWQKATSNVTSSTRRVRVGGIARPPVHPQPDDAPGPQSRGRRFRDEPSFEPVIFAYLGTAALTILYFFVPASLAPMLGLGIAAAGSLPLVLSRYSTRAKLAWALPLWIAALILLFATARSGAWGFAG
ncbi:MAG: hypothetical protein ACYS0F_17085 [Planctomycetota bacterium]|jgi:hypothetical protein